MKTQILVSIFSLSLLFSCSEEDICLVGDGHVNEYELDLASIHAVQLNGPVNLQYTQGATQSVTILAESQMYHDLNHKVRDGVLTIGYDGNVRCFETDYGVWINITAPVLNTISASGVNDIITNGPINQNSIKIIASGTANVELSGTVSSQTLKGDGVLNASNFNLESEKTTIDISGSANLEVSCSEQLNIDVTGSATIKYKGTPSINKTVSGSLSLIDYNN